MLPQPPLGLLDERRTKPSNRNSENHHLTQAYVINSCIREENGCKVVHCDNYYCLLETVLEMSSLFFCWFGTFGFVVGLVCFCLFVFRFLLFVFFPEMVTEISTFLKSRP